MKIAFLVNEVAGGWEPTDTRLGGTEESVVEWSEHLVKLGHEVKVYRNGAEFTFNKVYYYPRGDYIPNHDVCINVKSSDILPKEPTVYLTNETNASSLDLSPYSCVVWPSQWAKDNIPVNNDRIYVVEHGYNPEEVFPGEKIPKQCFYASSPDRGLSVLLDAWPKVHEEQPDATLIITYGGKSALPGVISLGEADKDTMNEVYRTSDIWCHPCTGVELFCITGKKAQVAGCIPVIIPNMALSETVERGFKVSTPNDYARTLIEVLNMKQEHRDSIRQDIIKHANALTWQQSTQKLLRVIEKVVN